MPRKKLFTALFKRKRERRTNYGDRLALLKSKLPRLIVRKSNKNILAQLIKYGDTGDIIIKTVHSRELEKYGWSTSKGNIPTAYLVGLLIGKKAEGQEAILDIGLQGPIRGTRIFAVLKGAVDGGLKINYSEEVAPGEDRLTGKHISDYANLIKEDKEKFEKIFSAYLNNKKDPSKIQEYFESTKEKILSVKE